MCYTNELTFFLGCMVLHSHFATSACLRSSSSEASVTGSVQTSDTPARYRLKATVASGGVLDAVTGFVQRTYPLALLQWVGKMAVVFLFVFYIAITAWGASQLQESFQLESVRPRESYYAKHIQVNNTSTIGYCYYQGLKC